MSRPSDHAAQQLAAGIKGARSLGLQTTTVTVVGAELLLAEREELLTTTPADSAAPSMSDAIQQIVDELQRDGIPIYRARWAPEDCTCPWPWPTMTRGSTEAGHVLTHCPHFRVPRATDKEGQP